MNRQFSYGSATTTSEQIRQEIQRFESVHPCIYAIYDLIDSVPDLALANHIRENVVCIEDSFVNSQEWTLSRAAPDLKLGVVGSLSSGKSALVHRYLTGSYMQEESPEGGRFKKEVVLDGQPYLLLIRDEGGPPEQQFTHWVDAVMFVFSLENETSFNAVYNYYAKMAHYRNTADIPMILVGTQDSISESNPRIIDENRARKLANDLKRCAYYETCATYGLNVERVFRDACVKIIQQRLQHSQQQCQQNNSNSSSSSTNVVAPPPSSCPSTPSHQTVVHHNNQQQQRQFNFYSPSPIAVQSTSALPGLLSNNSNSVISSSSSNNHHHHHPSPLQTNNSNSNAVVFRNNADHHQPQQNNGTTPHALATSPIRKQQQQPNGGASSVSSSDSPSFTMLGISPATSNHSVSSLHQWSNQQHSHSTPCGAFAKDQQEFKHPANFVNNSNRSSNLSSTNLEPSLDVANQLPTPSSTPTTQRKNRRISNIFNRKDDDKVKFSISNDAGGIGVGRAIPVKQGNLCKKSSKTLNKEWKKKYVCLFHDGRLTYYPSLRDYMDDAHGKEIYLGHTTVKVPGQRPRGSQQPRSHTQPIMTNGLTKENAKINGNKVLLTSFEAIREGKASTSVGSSFDASFLSNNHGNGDDSRIETPNLKKKDKKHLRKSSQIKNGDLDDSDNYEFIVVSINNKQWHFEAENCDEREQWVQAIEQQILSSLQSNSSNKSGSARAHGDRSAVQALRNIPGNSHCADCGCPNPDWASLNLGTLICIECCGAHRNLGTHISKVRSLDLDEWPVECLNVMHAIGNKVANGIWEFNTKGRLKPAPNASRDVKSAWIRSKYETREFLCPLPSPSSSAASTSLVEQIGETICKKDLRAVILLLAHCKSTSQINCTIGVRDLRTPLHLACAVGSPTIAQLLIWYNADVKALDHEGRSPMWYAKNSGSQECVDVLIHNGCPSDFLQSASTPVTRKNQNHSTSSSLTSDNLLSSAASTKSKTCNDAFDKLPASVI